MEIPENLSSHFLVAMPTLIDPNFSKSVIYIFEHSSQGALGMVINKPLQITLGNVFEHLGITSNNKKVTELSVLMGGPVNQEHGFIIHTGEESSKEQNKIQVSASREILEKIADSKGPKQFIITLGYSGWAEGQLENEIMRNDWLITPAAPNILFKTKIADRWQTAAKLIGIDITRLSDQVGHA